MKLNRKWLMVIALVLSMTMAISGTLAYLTDTDNAKNTFVVGKVDIDLDEPNYGGDDQTLLPGIEIPKDPEITNTGNTEAWVWMEITLPTLLYREAPDSLDAIDWNETDWTIKSATESGDKTTVTIVYNEKLAPRDKTNPVFTRVFIPDTANSDDMAKLTSPLEIDVTAFAVQSDAKIDTIEEAMRAYKGEVISGGPNVPADAVIVKNTAEAQAALDNAASGTTIKLEAGDYGTLYLRQSDKSTTVPGSEVNGVGYDEAKLREFKNLTIVGANGAKVDSIVAEAWQYHWSNSGNSHSQFDGTTGTGDSFYSFINLENVKIHNIEFSGSKNGVNLPGYVSVNGLEINGCAMDATTSGVMLLNKSDNDVQAANASFDYNGGKFFTLQNKNVKIIDCEVNGADRLANMFGVDGLTVQGNTASNLKQHFVLVQGGKTLTTTGDINFVDNTVTNNGDRFLRAANAKSAEVTLDGNNVTVASGMTDADIVKVTGNTNGDITTVTYTDTNNNWPAGKTTLTFAN